jgi:hydroxymethylpyrimidine pyrophosphatase-like HAD family hydrolase
MAVGSGGSFTAAEFAAALHRGSPYGAHASAHSPLEAAATAVALHRTIVFMSTAGGANPDVLGSFRVLASREPKQLIVLCLRRGTPLARSAARFPFVDFFEHDLPTGRDGFLATNSLLASLVLLTRAYAVARGIPSDLPQLWPALLPARTLAEMDKSLAPAWTKRTLIVLHGADTRVAAVDLESRFTEAALGNLWTSDYRQFAHGRHHWLAKNTETSAVLAFTTTADKELASKTLALIPPTVPVARIDIPLAGTVAAVSAVVRGIFVAASAGRAVGIDPGRPGVPGFGRRIYRLNAFAKTALARPDAATAAIERKTGTPIAGLRAAGTLRFWHDAYRAFVDRITRAGFAGVVIDYDGTLCSAEDRATGLRQDLADELARLLKAGARVGIATGRGKSVRKELRNVLPESSWEQLIVGYYNGGDIGPLSDDAHPNGSEETSKALEPVADALRRDPRLKGTADFELRRPQIKVQIIGPMTEWGREMVEEIVRDTKICGVTVVHSAHSMDILAPGVTKESVIRSVETTATAASSAEAILCIGDRGRYPGNDHALLKGPHALTVDEASPDPWTCWNLAPLGFRNVAACRYYLSHLRLSRGRLRLQLP